MDRKSLIEDSINRQSLTSLIEFFIKQEVRDNPPDKLFWPKETVQAKSLLKKFPLNFYLTITDLEGKLNSLRFFGSNKGKGFINTQQVMNAENKQYYRLPKIEEFLNKYK